MSGTSATQKLTEAGFDRETGIKLPGRSLRDLRDAELLRVYQFALQRYDPEAFYWDATAVSGTASRARIVKHMRTLDLGHLVGQPSQLRARSSKALHGVEALLAKLEARHGARIYRRDFQAQQAKVVARLAGKENAPSTATRLARAAERRRSRAPLGETQTQPQAPVDGDGDTAAAAVGDVTGIFDALNGGAGGAALAHTATIGTVTISAQALATPLHTQSPNTRRLRNAIPTGQQLANTPLGATDTISNVRAAAAAAADNTTGALLARTPAATGTITVAHEPTPVNRPLRNMIPTGNQLARSPTVVVPPTPAAAQTPAQPDVHATPAQTSERTSELPSAHAAVPATPSERALRNVIPSGPGLARTPLGQEPQTVATMRKTAQEQSLSSHDDASVDGDAPSEQPAAAEALSPPVTRRAAASPVRKPSAKKPAAKRRQTIAVSRPRGRNMIPTGDQIPNSPVAQQGNDAIASRTRSRSPAPNSPRARRGSSGGAPMAASQMNKTMTLGGAAAAQRKARNVIPTGQTLAHTPPAALAVAASPRGATSARKTRRQSALDRRASASESSSAPSASSVAEPSAASPEVARNTSTASPSAAAAPLRQTLSPMTRAQRNAIPSGPGLARTPVGASDITESIVAEPMMVDTPQPSAIAPQRTLASPLPAVAPYDVTLDEPVVADESPLRAVGPTALTPRVPATPLGANGWSANDHSAPSSVASSVNSDAPSSIAGSTRPSPLAIASMHSSPAAIGENTGPIRIGSDDDDADAADADEASASASMRSDARASPAAMRRSTPPSAQRARRASSLGAAVRSPLRTSSVPSDESPSSDAASSPANAPAPSATDAVDDMLAGADFEPDFDFGEPEQQSSLSPSETDDGMTRADREFVEESQRAALAAQLKETAAQVAAAQRRRESLERHHADAAAQLSALEAEQNAEIHRLQEQIGAMGVSSGKPLPTTIDELRAELERLHAEQSEAERVPQTLDEAAADVAAAAAAEARRSVALRDRAHQLGAAMAADERAKRSRKRRRDMIDENEQRVDAAKQREKRARETAARAAATVTQLERERERLPPAPARSALAPANARRTVQLSVVSRARQQRVAEWSQLPARQRRAEIAKKRVAMFNLRVAVLKNNENIYRTMVDTF